MTSSPQSPVLIGPRRRLFQWGVTLLVLLLPWLSLHGESLFLIDIPGLRILFFGMTIRIQELYLVLFFGLALALGFLLMTLVVGRVWCGWACPQTTLNDLTEWLITKTGLRLIGGEVKGEGGRKLVLHLLLTALSILVGMNLLWYFIPPVEFFRQLMSLQLHWAATLTLALVAVSVYLDLAFLRRLVCRDFCPYGRYQAALVDPATLVLHRPDSEIPRCIECGACVHVCPMGIDIREGYQIECINCGRCLDACRQVMAVQQEPGLIRYSFGTAGEGARRLINPRTLLLAALTLGLLLLLAVAGGKREPVSLSVAYSHTAQPRLISDQEMVSFFNVWVNNRSREERRLDLIALSQDGTRSFSLRGPVRAILLAPGENRRIDLALVSPPVAAPLPIRFVLVQDGAEVVESGISLNPLSIIPQESKP